MFFYYYHRTALLTEKIITEDDINILQINFLEDLKQTNHKYMCTLYLVNNILYFYFMSGNKRIKFISYIA